MGRDCPRAREPPMMASLRSLARQWLASVGRGILSPLVFWLAKRPQGAEMPISVHMLVSSRTWHAGLLAAISFEHSTGRRWPLFIHDDGSVSLAQRQQIKKVLPGVMFIPRSDSDRETSCYLADYPTCLAHRNRHNLFLKFFDACPFAPHDRFIVLDSDVIFFKRPAEILEWADNRSPTCLYNEDTREKFCIPRDEIEKALPVTLLPRFNSGLVLMQKQAFNLNLASQLLGAFETTAHAPQFFEQTLYALMASTNPGGGAPLPRTYNISWGYWRDRGSICRHYVGDFKHDLLYIEGAPLLLMGMLTKSLK